MAQRTEELCNVLLVTTLGDMGRQTLRSRLDSDLRCYENSRAAKLHGAQMHLSVK